MVCNCTSNSIPWTAVSDKLCVEVICFTTAPSTRLSPIIVHCVLFHSAALIMLRLFAQACHCSLFSSNHSQSQHCCPELWWHGEKRKINNRPHLPNKRQRTCTESFANTVQSKIIKLPVRLGLIFTNIWQDGFLLWICFGLGFWRLSRH